MVSSIKGHLPGYRLLGAVSLLAALLVTAAVASPAMAAPKGEYAVFSECPVTSAFECLYAKTESGKIQIGKETVPIEKAIVLQGGLNPNSEGTFSMVAAKGGNTLVKSPQKVPGGLSGLVKCNEISNYFLRISCEAIFENGVTGVNATTELAGPASAVTLNLGSYLEESGTALSLPVKVHLENPLLGSSCYVGSNSAPIVVNLSTGKSGSATGRKGEFAEPAEGILEFNNSSLVNNTFAAPAATGCGLFGLLDGTIDSRLGLPSGSGANTAILNGKIETAEASVVKANE